MEFFKLKSPIAPHFYRKLYSNVSDAYRYLEISKKKKHRVPDTYYINNDYAIQML